MRGVSRGDNGDGYGDGVPILVDAVSMEGRQRRGYLDNDVNADEDPFGFDLLPGGLDGFISVLLHGPGGVNCADRFTNMSRGMTSERTRVRRGERGEGRRVCPGYFTLPLPLLMMWPFLPRAEWCWR